MDLKAQDFLSNIEALSTRYKADVNSRSFFGYPLAPVLKAEERLQDKNIPSVAYLSMEYGLAPGIYHGFEKARLLPTTLTSPLDLFSNLRNVDYFVPLQVARRPDMPIYSGGLGVLAGDTVKSAADLGISMVAVGILWHQGYFRQNLGFKYGQDSAPVEWDPEHFPGLVPIKQRLKISLLHDTIHLKLWKYYVYSQDKKHVVPMVLLDANLPENTDKVGLLTAQLYRSDDVWLKVLQRVVLGVGGVEALKVLGYEPHCYHLNEGHAVFAFVQEAKDRPDNEHATLRNRFVFTCHTPVLAGHDRFDMGLAADILPSPYVDILKKYAIPPNEPNTVNLTHLAMSVCSHVNAVSQKHGEIMRLQFPDFAQKIQSITNGIHHATWISEPVGRLLDKHAKKIGPWREDPSHLKNVLGLKDNRIFRQGLWEAHQENKRGLCNIFEKWRFREDVLTVAWARRLAGYKRPHLILHDLKSLLTVAERCGGMQIVLAGKAHPNDRIGFEFVKEILDRIDELENHKDLIRVIMLENFDTFWGKLLSTSVDIWLNNPLPPFEASGTSGMKAILNGVPQLTTLDGWVVEAAHQDIGRTFGYSPKGGEIGNEGDWKMDDDAKALYQTLEEMGTLYRDSAAKGPGDQKNAWVTMMIHCVAQAHHFNTHRMLKDYQSNIWKF